LETTSQRAIFNTKVALYFFVKNSIVNDCYIQKQFLILQLKIFFNPKTNEINQKKYFTIHNNKKIQK
jgi:hypothetical protein